MVELRMVHRQILALCQDITVADFDPAELNEEPTRTSPGVPVGPQDDNGGDAPEGCES